MLPDSSVRLNKYISESGICSRREADRYIEQGNVFLNGKRATIGDQVKPGDVVKVNGQLIEPREAEDLLHYFTFFSFYCLIAYLWSFLPFS